ncbi:nuclear body protein SP140-like protein isoform X2 [Latimeria chalumnae]|uniref:nuclear body protein SP140-like protein isoform X2 n=1 Tax=Latimeria chalumnae TaxID=7897 RepID=UPI00313BA9C8
MSHLSQFTDEELYQKLKDSKTEISQAINFPFPFLNVLSNIITEQQLQKLIHWFLSRLEEEGDPQTIRTFWSKLLSDENRDKYSRLDPLDQWFREGAPISTQKRKYESSEFSTDSSPESPVTRRSVSRRRRKGTQTSTRKRKYESSEFSTDSSPESPVTRRSVSRRRRKGTQKSNKKKYELSESSTEDSSPKPPVTRRSARLCGQRPTKDAGKANQETDEVENRTAAGAVDFSSKRLPVTCGPARGWLSKKKLAQSTTKKCILRKDEDKITWFSPTQFEAFGGRGSHKNWKLSILCGGYKLRDLIELGKIKIPSKKTGKRLPQEQTKINQRTGSPSPDSARLEQDSADRSSSSMKIPVKCGGATGTLYSERFATGSRGKCIRTDTKWYTPEEFVKEGGMIESPDWKKDIHYQGESLKDLMKKEILKQHPKPCVCDICFGLTEGQMQENDDECMVCKDVGNLTCCDDCPRAFHRLCHIPLLTVTEDSSEKWSCTFCRMKAQNELSRGPRFKEESEILIQKLTDRYMLSCEYLLLKLYCQKESVVFAKNPCDTVTKYAKTIEKPMWLDQIQENLAQKKYNTVGKFINDVRLIFKNCQKFNQMNEFGQLGAQLSEDFERNFKEVLPIE